MTDGPKRTPLYEEHLGLGGKMVPFAGYSMPVQYPTGITTEHAAVRDACGLFDVSHMGEFIVRGPQALDLVQRISVNDAARIEVGQAQYSAMCLETGAGTSTDTSRASNPAANSRAAIASAARVLSPRSVSVVLISTSSA
jgi:glycine cleavage system aminomethyltransferase T